jgi:archaellum component FlaC
MLTVDDLRKIGELVDQRLEVKLDSKLEPIKKDILTIKEDISGLKKDIKSLKSSDRRISKDLGLVLKYSDGARANHEKRITQIEDHLHLSSME